MAARPSCRLSKANITAKTVVTTPVVQYRVVSLNTSDSQCVHTAAGAAGYGVAQEAGAVGAVIPVAVLGCGETTRVLVGTGGATRGAYAVVVADGVTNSGTLGGGTVLKNIVGRFEETGVAGDIVGMVLQDFASVSA